MSRQKTTVSAKKDKAKIRTNFTDKVTSYPYAFLLLAILAIICFAGVTGNKAVNFDDDSMLANISTVHSSSFQIFVEAFSRDAWVGTSKPFYRPVQTFFLLLFGNEGQKPGSFFITLLLIHILNSFLVYILSARITKNKLPSLIIAMIFTVHPLVTPAIGWIPATGDALLTMFALLSVISIFIFWENRNMLFLALHIVFYAVAVFTKETAIFLPIVILGFWFLFQPVTDRFKGLVYNLCTLAFWIFLAVVYFKLRANFLQTHGLQSIIQPGIRDVIQNLRVIPELAFKTVFPFNLSLISSFSMVRTVGGLIILAGIPALLYLRVTGKYMYIYGAAWFIILLSPTLVFTHPSFDYLEHRSYLPLIGLLIVISGIPFKGSFRWVLISIIPVFMVTSILYGKSFRDPLSFYNKMVKNSGLPMTYNNRAIERTQAGDAKGALADYDQAVSIDPTYTDAYINRANLKVSAFNDYEAAIGDYNKAIDFLKTGKSGSYLLRRDYSDVYNNRGLIKVNMNDISGALQDYGEAIRMNPSFAEAYNNRALLKGEKANDSTGAMLDFNKAIEINPAYAQAYNNRGVLKEIKFKDYQGALNDYTNAIKISKDYADAWFNRGMCYFSINQPEQACADMKIAAGTGHQGAIQFINEKCR